jgi:hypothetical protein
MRLDLVLMFSRQTTPSLPVSSPCFPPGLTKEKKPVTKSRLLFLVTARPRGWKWRLRSGSLQRLFCTFTWPMILGRTVLRRLPRRTLRRDESITVIVS